MQFLPSAGTDGGGCVTPGNNLLKNLWWRLALVVLATLAVNAGPVVSWFTFSVRSELYSYCVLIPAAAAWLFWRRRQALASVPVTCSPVLAIVLAVAAVAIGSVSANLASGGDDEQRAAVAGALMLVVTLWSYSLALLGWGFVRRAAVPFLYILLITPFPATVETAVEDALQHGSAETAALLFALLPVPLIREGLVFHLPGLNLMVAPECSGIHSTVVLFVVSILAGELFLRSGWHRWLVTLAVFPLGMLRNALRILTIGLLTVYVDPDVINGPLHHRGGPIFFVLSLAVFLLILAALRKAERKREAAVEQGSRKDAGSAAG